MIFTPSPWHVVKDKFGRIYFTDDTGRGIAEFIPAPRRKNDDAYHVARCVNTHDALFDVARRAIGYVRAYGVSKYDGFLETEVLRMEGILEKAKQRP